jgi:Mn-containing catalase
MAIDSGYLKHLEMIGQTISRMAANSFLLKGWSVTLLSAILALTVKEEAYRMIWVAFLPCIMFWALDGYYLRQERLFRSLWDAQREKNQEAPTDFSMNTQPFDAQGSPWAAMMFSKTLVTFHGTLLLILVLVAAWTYCRP